MGIGLKAKYQAANHWFATPWSSVVIPRTYLISYLVLISLCSLMIFLSTQNKPSVGSSPQKTDTAHAVVLERSCYTGREWKTGLFGTMGSPLKSPIFISFPLWPYIVLEINLLLLYFLKCFWSGDKALYSRDREFTAWLADALCHFLTLNLINPWIYCVLKEKKSNWKCTPEIKMMAE